MNTMATTMKPTVCVQPYVASRLRATSSTASRLVLSAPVHALRKNVASLFRGKCHAVNVQRALTICSDVEIPPIPKGKSKVKVVLGGYKDGAIQVTVPEVKISDEEIDAELKKKGEATYKLNRINFTGGGARIGHTVKLNFEAVYADGPKSGQSIKGTQAKMFELDLQEGKPLPWSDFVQNIIVAGMGQEESKSFVTTFPEDYAAKPLRGVRARFNITVKEISEKEMLEIDTRPLEEQRAEIAATFEDSRKRKQNAIVDAAIRKVLEKSSTTDTKKVADSVTWAKFGPKSLAEFAWNLILEEVSLQEGIPFDQVTAFLRSNATITYGTVVEEDAEDEVSFD